MKPHNNRIAMLDKAYYNENDPKMTAWLRQLIKNGLIANGVVDDRSITEVLPGDLAGFTQYHFFAGIGGWSYALRLANWPDNKAVCTASLPCQPFSLAGKQNGINDERHLLPHFLELTRKCKFPVIFGEQVPGAIKHGWLDDLCTHMGKEGYTTRANVLTASGAGAPHIRQRLYWMAYPKPARLQGGIFRRTDTERENFNGQPGRGGAISRMGNTKYDGHATDKAAGSTIQASDESEERPDVSCEPTGTSGRKIATDLPGCEEWRTVDWLYCRDGKYRAIKPGLKPLVDGLSERVVRGGDTSQSIDDNNTQEARVMRLKGYGNAIVPQVASSFIRTYLKKINE